ncbi:hypothetical protein O0L34_g8016 [Tuta absoluta]|nr:hypothetical protein O0L34_g8016 [Tuta absoluta]
MQYGYQSLLPQILPRQTTARPPVVAFNCNICESSFQKSVEFSEHIIRVHKAEPSKDCCVCRHKKIEKAFSRIDPPSLFRCQYCDQTFTRSYCCELHELHCPMRRGRAHELPENLVILS